MFPLPDRSRETGASFDKLRTRLRLAAAGASARGEVAEQGPLVEGAWVGESAANRGGVKAVIGGLAPKEHI